MRIEPNLTTTPAPVSQPEGGTKVTAKSAVREGEGSDAVGGFSPTAHLANLLALVKEVPEMRGELIQEVLERSSAGELATRTAATDTAAAILDANTGG